MSGNLENVTHIVPGGLGTIIARKDHAGFKQQLIDNPKKIEGSSGIVYTSELTFDPHQGGFTDRLISEEGINPVTVE